jgi:hypothetical protein
MVWSAPSKPPTIVRDAPETFGTDEAKKTGWAARKHTSNQSICHAALVIVGSSCDG